MALEQYRRQGFAFDLLQFRDGASRSRRRRETIAVLVDAAFANLVADLVSRQVVDTLIARFAGIRPVRLPSPRSLDDRGLRSRARAAG